MKILLLAFGLVGCVTGAKAPLEDCNEFLRKRHPELSSSHVVAKALKCSELIVWYSGNRGKVVAVSACMSPKEDLKVVKTSLTEIGVCQLQDVRYIVHEGSIVIDKGV